MSHGIPLGLQDAAFLHLESDTCPTHVAGLQIFEPPRDAGDDFVGELTAALMAQAPTAFFRRRIRRGYLGIGLAPQWEVVDAIDMEYHVRRLAVPQPGSRAQLERVVERLHARVLDRDRPLWECYLIEGLAGGRFAVYFKVHHALVDGMAGMMLALAAMSPDPAAPARAIWAVEVPEPTERARAPLSQRMADVRDRLRGIRRMTTGQLIGWAGRSLGAQEQRALAFAAPRTGFNGRIGHHRRLATRSLPMDRVRALARAADATINDLVLALTGGALRRWLSETDQLPPETLLASCPVSVRQGQGTGNNISMMLADLATDEAEPLARLRRIQTSSRSGKQALGGISSGAAESWALAMSATTMLPMLTGGSLMTRQPANIIVSNVPGAREPRYLGGAEAVAHYPVSVLTHGQGLNVTVLSCAQSLDFGLLGARELAPNMDRLADALPAAFEELEAAVEADLQRRAAHLSGAGAGAQAADEERARA